MGREVRNEWREEERENGGEKETRGRVEEEMEES